MLFVFYVYLSTYDPKSSIHLLRRCRSRHPQDELRRAIVARHHVGPLRLTEDHALGGAEVADLQRVALAVQQQVLPGREAFLEAPKEAILAEKRLRMSSKCWKTIENP